jgi:thiamine pyrophosphokinase
MRFWWEMENCHYWKFKLSSKSNSFSKSQVFKDLDKNIVLHLLNFFDGG